jgi:uncharacterized protein (TIGR02246 family)
MAEERDIEQRLRRLEDRQAIADLVVRYCWAVDDRDRPGLLALFAADASMPIGGRDVHGGAAVVDALFVRRAEQTRTVHTVDSCLVTALSDDSADGLVQAHVEAGTAGTTQYGALRYRDRYVRRDGVWRFARREMTVVHMGPWAEVAGSLI